MIRLPLAAPHSFSFDAAGSEVVFRLSKRLGNPCCRAQAPPHMRCLYGSPVPWFCRELNKKHPRSSFWISPQGNFPRGLFWISLGLVDLSRTPSGTFFWEVHPGSEMASQNDQNKAK